MSDSTLSPSGAVDDELNVLAHRYCRVVLHYFRFQSTDVATIDDLKSFICERHDSDDDETAIATHLHHSTLPRLADANVIDYDVRSNTARYRTNPFIEKWLNHVVEREDAIA